MPRKIISDPALPAQDAYTLRFTTWIFSLIENILFVLEDIKHPKVSPIVSECLRILSLFCDQLLEMKSMYPLCISLIFKRNKLYEKISIYDNRSKKLEEIMAGIDALIELKGSRRNLRIFERSTLSKLPMFDSDSDPDESSSKKLRVVQNPMISIYPEVGNSSLDLSRSVDLDSTPLARRRTYPVNDSEGLFSPFTNLYESTRQLCGLRWTGS